MTPEFSQHIFKKYSNINFHENLFSGSWGSIRMDGQTAAFSNFANAPKMLTYLQMDTVLYICQGLGVLPHHSSHCQTGLEHQCQHVLDQSPGGWYATFPGQTRDCLRSYVLVRQHPIYCSLANTHTTHHSIHPHACTYALSRKCMQSTKLRRNST